MRIRLLPIVIVAAALLMSLRVGGLWDRIDIDLGTASVAQTEPADAAAAASADEPPPGDDAAPAEGGAAGAAPAGPERDRAAVPEDDGAPEGGLEAVAQDRSELDLDEVTPAEIKVLEELAARRRELEERERDLEFREGLLKATEQRVEEKIEELKALQGELQALIDRKDEEEIAKLKSLVEIYSKMKPKEAARVFERLEMPLLLSVIGEMKERISAAILAEMDPQRVSEITAEIAREDDLAAIPE